MFWMDLSSGDPAFYQDLFGWRLTGAGVFTMDGQVVAGYGAPGVPLGGSRWAVHAVVDDVHDCCQVVKRLGGAVLTGPVPWAAGELAVLADPAGAAFVVREPGTRAEAVHRPMAFSWAELCTPAPDPARKFYCGLFGWDTMYGPMSMPSGETGYTVFLAGAQEVAGMLPAGAAFGPVAPPYWLPYIEVTDADAVADRTAGLGGGVPVEPFDVPRIGRIALLAGRYGEMFAVMQLPAGCGDGR